MGPAPNRKINARNVGAGTLLVLAALGLGVWYGLRAEWWKERCLVLATVKDASKLELGAPVYFRGVDVGKVTMLKPPSADLPGYKLRMAVDQAAFKHIPLDSTVRIDPGRMNLPMQVTILPGLDEPDWDYPGDVKPLREVTPTEDTLRLIKDVLDGIGNASQLKAAQADALDLKEEIKKLRAEIEKLRKQEQSDQEAGKGE
ncbi:MAG TPA: MlaD family protein [bacterium]|nr:MlaD family protein [bacterium]